MNFKEYDQFLAEYYEAEDEFWFKYMAEVDADFRINHLK